MGRLGIHPGEHLAEELKALDMSAAELARQLKVPTNRVAGILNGQRAITGDTALRRGHYFGTRPEIWLNLQAIYDGRLAERKAVQNKPPPESHTIGGSIRVEPEVFSPNAGGLAQAEDDSRQVDELHGVALTTTQVNDPRAERRDPNRVSGVSVMFRPRDEFSQSWHLGES